MDGWIALRETDDFDILSSRPECPLAGAPNPRLTLAIATLKRPESKDSYDFDVANLKQK